MTAGDDRGEVAGREAGAGGVAGAGREAGADEVAGAGDEAGAGREAGADEVAGADDEACAGDEAGAGREAGADDVAGAGRDAGADEVAGAGDEGGAGGDAAARADFAAFKAFEADGWSARAGTYDALMARATALAIEPLLDTARIGPGTRVLDVGCGLGTLAAAAAARGAIVTGADLAAGMLAEARRRHPQIEFVLADAEALPFADDAFDVALGAFIVNHLPHPERAAAELKRVARGVALAMWGPEDEVALLGLPAAAARDLDAAIPPGPDSLRFTNADELARLIGGTVTERHETLRIDSLDELWDGVRGGTVRTAARLAAASPETRARVRAHLAELAEPYRTPRGYALPTTIRIAVVAERR